MIACHLLIDGETFLIYFFVIAFLAAALSIANNFFILMFVVVEKRGSSQLKVFFSQSQPLILYESYAKKDLTVPKDMIMIGFLRSTPIRHNIMTT